MRDGIWSSGMPNLSLRRLRDPVRLVSDAPARTCIAAAAVDGRVRLGVFTDPHPGSNRDRDAIRHLAVLGLSKNRRRSGRASKSRPRPPAMNTIETSGSADPRSNHNPVAANSFTSPAPNSPPKMRWRPAPAELNKAPFCQSPQPGPSTTAATIAPMKTARLVRLKCAYRIASSIAAATKAHTKRTSSQSGAKATRFNSGSRPGGCSTHARTTSGWRRAPG